MRKFKNVYSALKNKKLLTVFGLSIAGVLVMSILVYVQNNHQEYRTKAAASQSVYKGQFPLVDPNKKRTEIHESHKALRISSNPQDPKKQSHQEKCGLQQPQEDDVITSVTKSDKPNKWQPAC